MGRKRNHNPCTLPQPQTLSNSVQTFRAGSLCDAYPLQRHVVGRGAQIIQGLQRLLAHVDATHHLGRARRRDVLNICGAA